VFVENRDSKWKHMFLATSILGHYTYITRFRLELWFIGCPHSGGRLFCCGA
jgi:hypothetical protein